jgi:3-isopropylmalate/(R)-2-methylmalate dehydratase large subunit
MLPMGKTLTEKLLAMHSPAQEVSAGDWIVVSVDLALATDVSAAMCIEAFKKIGADDVFDRERLILVNDHFVPAKDIQSAGLSKSMREFAHQFRIPNYFEVGRSGISHSLLPELGLVLPGDLLLGADSHTCTAGAVGAFATGMGATSIGVVWALGETWLKVPESIKVLYNGKPPEWIVGKDLILKLIQDLGVDGGNYTALEFGGTAMPYLKMSDRMTLCNMAVEAGCKSGVVPPDEVTEEYVAVRAKRAYNIVKPDPDATYKRIIEFDVSEMSPLVACPYLPSNVKPAQELAKENIRINQVMIGSCTNGSIDDMRMAHQILKGHTVHPDVRLIVIPATQIVYLQAMREGILDDFVSAGAVVSTSTCGPCLGGHMGVLGDDEVSLATTSRNFAGRMGAQTSKSYLANPAVAAATAILGRVADPREII